MKGEGFRVASKEASQSFLDGSKTISRSQAKVRESDVGRGRIDSIELAL